MSVASGKDVEDSLATVALSNSSVYRPFPKTGAFDETGDTSY